MLGTTKAISRDLKAAIRVWADQWVAREVRQDGIHVKKISVKGGINSRYKITHHTQRSFMEYDNPNPEPVENSFGEIWGQELTRRNSSDQDRDVPIAYSDQRSATVTLSIERSFEFALPINITIGAVGGSIAFTHGKKSTQAQSKEITTRWGIDEPVRIPAHTEATFNVTVSQGTMILHGQVLVPTTGHAVIRLNKSIRMPGSCFHCTGADPRLPYQDWFVPIETIFKNLNDWGIETPGCAYKEGNVYLVARSSVQHNAKFRSNIVPNYKPLENNHQADVVIQPVVELPPNEPPNQFDEQPPDNIAEPPPEHLDEFSPDQADAQPLLNVQNEEKHSCFKTEREKRLTGLLVIFGTLSLTTSITAIIKLSQQSNEGPPNHLLPTTTPPPNGTTPRPPGDMSDESINPLVLLAILSTLATLFFLYIACHRAKQIKACILSFIHCFSHKAVKTIINADIQVTIEPTDPDLDLQPEPTLLSDEEDFETDSSSDSDSDDEFASPGIAPGSMASGASRMFQNPLHSVSSAAVKTGRYEDDTGEDSASAAGVNQPLLRSG